jgi:hypothetical protein
MKEKVLLLSFLPLKTAIELTQVSICFEVWHLLLIM